jgi:hypothetical protein
MPPVDWIQIVCNIHTPCGGYRPIKDLKGMVDFIQAVLAGSAAETEGALEF